MSRPKIVLLSTPNHPLYPSLSKLGHPIFTCQNTADFLRQKSSLLPVLPTSQFFFDFTVMAAAEKKLLLQQLHPLTLEFNLALFTEASCSWGEEILALFPQVQGLFSTAFFSPTQNYEYYTAPAFPMAQQGLTDFFQHLGLTGISSPAPGLGFIFPRTISMVINEAYWALQENLASSADIDKAMQFGTNYPLGPVEWAQKIGPEKIVYLLDELKQVTGDGRYNIAPLLRQEALTVNNSHGRI